MTNDPNALSVPEKILRVQDLWDEIASSLESVELTPAQRQEAERRVLEHDRHPGTYSQWNEIKHRLEREP